MPEPYWPKRRGSLALSDAARQGALIRVSCAYHKTTRFYRPADLIQIFGDLPVDALAYKMRCEQCRRDGSRPEIGTAMPSIAELQMMTIRRLERIKWERRVIWRDEKGA